MSAPSTHTLKPVTREDQAFLKEIFSTAMERAFASASLAPVQKQMLIDHQFKAQDESYHHQFPNANYDLILIDGEAAGRIYVDRGLEDLKLIEVTLLPPFQNQGIGTSLMNQLLEEAQTHQLPVILHVEHWNPDARRFYLRLGFQDDEDIGTHWRMRWEPTKRAG